MAVIVSIAVVWGIACYEILIDSRLRDDLHAMLVLYPRVAPFVLIACQVVLASFVLPCSPLTVLAGLLWGFHAGIVYSIMATMVGSLWTFALGRWVLKRWVLPEVTHEVYRKIERLITRYTWRASAIAHANPAFPGSSLGYAFGMTDVSLLSYVGGAVLGVLPLQVILVGLGSILGQTVVMATVPLVAALGGLVVVLMLYGLWAPRICGFYDSEPSHNHE